MTQYVDKSALVAEIEYLRKNQRLDDRHGQGVLDGLHAIERFINTLEVKTDEDNSLEKFKSLQHISRDLHQTLEDWGYAPNLYFFDAIWHVSWISCEEGDSIKDFEGNTPEEAIDKAYNWFHSTFCNN